MQDTQQAIAQYRELVSITLGGRAPTYPDWMMLGCAARDLGISFDLACQLVIDFRAGAVGGVASRQISHPVVGQEAVVPRYPTPVQFATAGATQAPAGWSTDDSHARPVVPQAPAQPEPEPAPASAPLEPLELEPIAVVAPQQPRVAPQPPAPSERMIAIEGGVYMPESYVMAARNIRAKFVEFLGARLPVITSAAARNALITIETFAPGLAVPPAPPSVLQGPVAPQVGSEPLSRLWEASSSEQTKLELDHIGRGALIVRSDRWKSIVVLSRLGWAAIDDWQVVRDGRIRSAVACDWFTLQAELIEKDSESGWFTRHVVSLVNPEEPWYSKRLVVLRNAADAPATVEFIKSLVTGVQAESASFAQQRKTLRALAARIDGADAASALLPSDGSIPEIQRAARAALAALSGALAIADTASC
jgi:hypothetical protein